MAQFNPMGSMGGGGGMAGFSPQNMQSFLGGASNPYDEEWMRNMLGGQGGPGGGMRGGGGGPQQPYGRPGAMLPGGFGGGGPQNVGPKPPGGGSTGGMPGVGGGTPYRPPQRPGYPPTPNTPPTVGVNTGNWGGVAGPGGLYKSSGTGGYRPGSWFPGR